MHRELNITVPAPFECVDCEQTHVYLPYIRIVSAVSHPGRGALTQQERLCYICWGLYCQQSNDRA